MWKVKFTIARGDACGHFDVQEVHNMFQHSRFLNKIWMMKDIFFKKKIKIKFKQTFIDLSNQITIHCSS